VQTLQRVAVVASLLLLSMLSQQAAAADPPFKMALLPDYKHEPLQGFDSIVGKIAAPKGLTINYEIGRVTKPGEIALGGSFSDQAKAVPAAGRQWYREQALPGKPVHLVLTNENMLLVSFPESGANFNTSVKTPADMADALLMILSYQGKK